MRAAIGLKTSSTQSCFCCNSSASFASRLTSAARLALAFCAAANWSRSCCSTPEKQHPHIADGAYFPVRSLLSIAINRSLVASPARTCLLCLPTSVAALADHRTGMEILIPRPRRTLRIFTEYALR